jgi:glycosyltransferase involved in cell wall biosynthesis
LKQIGYYRGGIDVAIGGVAPYADRLLRALDQHHFTGMQVTVIGRQEACQDVGFPKHLVKSNGLIRKLMFHASDSLYHLTHPKAGLRIGPYRRWLSRVHCDMRYDLLHFPFQVPPRATFRCPFIVTMHDVQELRFPEFFSPQERMQRAELYWGAISQASRVVVSFDHVKEDLLKYFRLPDARVVVIPVPYSQCVFADSTSTESAELSAKYRDLGRYFLYPAQTWRHKNHLGLIDAFERVCLRSAEPLRLVCTGVKNEFYQEIKERIDRSAVRDFIHFLGVVPQVDLKWLYRNSLSVVVPSLYEAGSFPLIEAMQLEVPVLCASTTSLPATIGDNRFVFDPRDSEQMASLMLKMASDQEYRQQGIYNSKMRMETLRQIKVGPLVEELWRTTLERPETS